MPTTADSIRDLITSTLKDLGRARWTNIAYDLQRYTIMPVILRKNRVKFESGTALQWNVLKNTAGSARHVGLGAKDNINIVDGLTTASVGWVNVTTNYAYERREFKMNRSPSKIVDLIKTRRAQGMIDLAKEMERGGWSKPTDSSDVLNPMGIPYYIVTNATLGFNGGNPSGFTSGAAGIDSTTTPNWRNYSGQYVNVSKDDLIDKMRQATDLTDFQSPVDLPEYKRGDDRPVIYTNYTTWNAMKKIGEAQNENLGRDLDWVGTTLTFRKAPIQWVPQLASRTDNPVYGVNWAYFYVAFLADEYMVEGEAEKVAGQHTVYAAHIDTTYNYRCDDRRRQWVLYA